MCCSDEEKGRLEELILACLRCGEWRVLEVVLSKILERQKLINWKVLHFARDWFIVFTVISYIFHQFLSHLLFSNLYTGSK